MTDNATIEADDGKNRRFIAAATGGVVALTCALYNRVVFAGEWLSARDTIRVYYPLAKFWVDELKAGRFPEWYPYNALGQPFVGMMVSGALHPSKLLYLLLPFEHALSAITLLCHPVAAFGTFLCARALGASRTGALFAGVTFAFSGYLVAISNNNAYLIACSTFPWVLYAAERAYREVTVSRVAMAGATLASIALAGETQTYALSAGAVLLWSVLRPSAERTSKTVAAAGGIVALGALFAAPQLLSAWSVLKDVREGLNTITMAERFSLHPLRLLEFPFGPLFIREHVGLIVSGTGRLTDRLMLSTWVDAVSVGAPALIFAGASLALLRTRRSVVTTVVVAALLVALLLGKYLPVYGLFYRFVPLWNVFRYPEKLVPFFTFVVAIGAGLTVKRLFEDSKFRKRVIFAMLAFALVSVGLIAAQLLGSLWSSSLKWLGVEASAVRPLSNWFMLLVAAVAVATALLALALWTARPAVAKPLLVIGQALLLLWMHLPLPQVVDVPVLHEPFGFTLSLQSKDPAAGVLGGPRVHSGAGYHDLPQSEVATQRDLLAVGLMATMEPDTSALFGYENTNYYLPAGSRRVVIASRQGMKYLTHVAPLWGAKYFTAEVDAAKTITASGAFTIVDNLHELGLLLAIAHNPQPRAYLAHPRCVTDENAALRTITDGALKAGIEVLIECGKDEAPLTKGGRPGLAEITSYQPNRVVVQVDASESGVLVLNDAFFRGWTAWVDGQRTDIQLANFAVRAVAVPSGRHEVVFEYADQGLRLGAAIAAATLLLVLAAVAFARRRVPTTPRQ